MTKRQKKKREQAVLREKLVLCIVFLVIAVAAIALLRTLSNIHSKNQEVTTITESQIEEVLEISELSTVEYTYNAVAQAYTDDGLEIRYYVAYDGIVKAGIDFEDIKITVDTPHKKITVTIPEVKILECTVDPGTFEYIFTEDKYDDAQTVPPEANKLCSEDLNKRANEEKEMLTLGRENAIAAVEGLIKPWVEQMDKQYVVEVK